MSSRRHPQHQINMSCIGGAQNTTAPSSKHLLPQTRKKTETSGISKRSDSPNWTHQENAVVNASPWEPWASKRPAVWNGEASVQYCRTGQMNELTRSRLHFKNKPKSATTPYPNRASPSSAPREGRNGTGLCPATRDAGGNPDSWRRLHASPIVK
jgi:hypothetical protein